MCLAVCYPLLLTAPLLVVAAAAPVSDHTIAGEAGAEIALVGFTMLSLQFVLAARPRWLEAPFGLDVLLVFHRVTALTATALLLAHPLLMACEQGWSLITAPRVPWYIWAGRISLLILLLHIAMSLFRRSLRLSYEQWRWMHNLLAPSVLLVGLVHSLFAGDELGGAGRFAWCAVPAVGLAAWAYHRWIRPRALAGRAFRVVSVEPETPRVWTVTLGAAQGKRFDFAAGQFQILRFLDGGLPPEDHPFTIASSPSCTDRISLTIKESGDFTGTLARVRPGDRAIVQGPFGRFSYELQADQGPFVFVAGGVGITPIISMLRAMRDRRESWSVKLIYCCRTIDDILFPGELCNMVAGGLPSLDVTYVLSHPPVDWHGESGRIHAARLNQWCRGLDGKSFYLCCPPRMTRDLIRGLRRHGVSPRRIHCDFFAL